MDDLINFNNSPPLYERVNDHSSILVPIRSSLAPNQEISQDNLQNLSENNFDMVADKVNLTNDPFEIRTHEKAHLTSNVRTANLILLGEEDVNIVGTMAPDDSSKPNRTDESQNIIQTNKNIFGNPKDNYKFNSEIVKVKDLCKSDLKGNTQLKENKEEILIDINDDNVISETVNNSDNNSNKSTPTSEKGSFKTSYRNDTRNRLLKLSLSNSLIQSPLSRKNSLEDGTSPEYVIYNEAAKLAKQLSLMNPNSPSSSPKKSDDSCDDLMSVNPNWIDSESDMSSNEFDFLKIPMLESLEKQEKNANEVKLAENFNHIVNENVDNNLNKSIDLEALKEKVKQHKMSLNCNKNFENLDEMNSDCNKNLENLDSVISYFKECVMRCNADGTKKEEAQKILESLGDLLTNNKMDVDNLSDKTKLNIEIKTEANEINKNESVPIRNYLVRQKTFDVDSENDSNSTKNSNETTSFQCQKIEKEIKQDIIEKDNDQTTSEKLVQPEVSNIVQQIEKLMGGKQNVNILQTNLNPEISTSQSNLAYIVVMGTPNKNVINGNNLCDQPTVSSPIQNKYRRRSNSLNLPNKKYITVHNDIHTKQINSSFRDNSPFKTPKRTNVLDRRNSFSSSTPQPNTKLNFSRQSLCGNTNLNNKTKTPVRSPIVNSTRDKYPTNKTEITKNFPRKSMINLQTELNSKHFRLKTSEKELCKGPLKATVQINSKPLIRKSINSSTTNQIDMKRRNTLNPSTVPLNKRNSIVKETPLACSTPLLISPQNSPPNNKKIIRQLTPKGKISSNLLCVTPNSQSNRRKSFSESASKIAIKTPYYSNANKSIKSYQDTPKSSNKSKFHTTHIPTVSINKENNKPIK